MKKNILDSQQGNKKNLKGLQKKILESLDRAFNPSAWEGLLAQGFSSLYDC